MQLLGGSSNDSSERCDNRKRKCVCSGEQHLDKEVSGVKRSFVMCDFSPTPWRAMSTDMARDCGSTAKRLSDRRLRAVL